jgi:hypothetical protein
MSKVHDFLARWTRIDEFLAPYNARIFERLAEGYGRTMMAISAGVGIAMLIASIGMTGVMASYGVQRLYLATYGVEVQATIVGIATDPSTGRRGQTRRMTTMNYTFTTRNSETINDTIRRAQWEFAGITQRSRIAVLYAESWPQINIPRIGLGNSTLLAFSLLLGFLFSLHMVCYLSRYQAWRRRKISLASRSVKAGPRLAAA